MPGPESTQPVLHCHADEATWSAAAATQLAATLAAAIAAEGAARILLSGGSTPAPAYRALASCPLDWSKVSVALVDERWLPAGHSDSNGRLVQETFLVGAAARAHFEPMLMADSRFEQCVQAANDRAAPATAVVLGMGADGHTASLFPGMRGLAESLDSASDYVGVDAGDSPGSAPWPRRISLTPAGLAKAGLRLLLIRGQAKRELLERALAGHDVLQLPVRAALFLPGTPLQMHWCP